MHILSAVVIDDDRSFPVFARVVSHRDLDVMYNDHIPSRHPAADGPLIIHPRNYYVTVVSCTIRLRFRRAIAESRRHASPAAIPNNNKNNNNDDDIIIIIYFITGLVWRCVSTHIYIIYYNGARAS